MSQQIFVSMCEYFGVDETKLSLYLPSLPISPQQKAVINLNTKAHTNILLKHSNFSSDEVESISGAVLFLDNQIDLKGDKSLVNIFSFSFNLFLYSHILTDTHTYQRRYTETNFSPTNKGVSRSLVPLQVLKNFGKSKTQSCWDGTMKINMTSLLVTENPLRRPFQQEQSLGGFSISGEKR